MGIRPHIGRAWRTVRHLKPVQVYGRAAFRLWRPRIDLRPAPPQRAGPGSWSPGPDRDPSLVGPTVLRVLGREVDLSQAGWDPPALDHLHRYNLHYFDDLASRGWESREGWHAQLMQRWVRDHRAPGVGWDPYPTSLRICNWIKWSLAGGRLAPECVHSLAVQARWLSRRVEWHLLANHLFVNAKALMFAGCFFTGPESDRWRAQAAGILRREVPEQFLEDGGHFERSPMYHGLLLEDVLDLVNLDRAFGGLLSGVVAVVSPRVPSMCRWLATMSHPDGEISFFNDSAFGIAARPAEVLEYACRLGFPPTPPPSDGCTLLRDSGFVRLQRGRAVVLADVGPVGPDYMPAHAHADTLSFELSLDGRRVVVNSGTSEYGHGAERQRQRGTAAHSTVVVAGNDSSEVWSGFRVGRRARPSGLSIIEERGHCEARCCHDGYRWLPGRPVHCRTWILRDDGLDVLDRVSRSVPFVARLHLAPGARFGGDGGVSMEGRCILRMSANPGLPVASPSTWHPRFGHFMCNEVISVSADGQDCAVRLRWT